MSNHVESHIFRQTLQYDRPWSSFLAKLWSSQASLFDSAITGSSRARRQCAKADFCIVVSKLADSNKTRGSVFQNLGFCRWPGEPSSLRWIGFGVTRRLEVTQSGPGNWRSQTSTAQRGSEHAATAPSSSYGQQNRWNHRTFKLIFAAHCILGGEANAKKAFRRHDGCMIMVVLLLSIRVWYKYRRSGIFILECTVDFCWCYHIDKQYGCWLKKHG